MQKIVLVNGYFLLQNISGSQRYAAELLSALGRLPQNKYRFILVVPGREANLVQKVEGVEILFYKFGLPSVFWTQVWLPKLAKKQGASAIWSPCSIGPIFPGLTHVVTVFDASVYGNKQWFNWKFRAYYRAVFAFYKYTAAHVITCSNFSMGELIKHLAIPRNMIEVVYASISKRVDCSVPSLPIKGKYILSLGARDPRKNVCALIDAWRQVPASVKSGRKLVVAGGKANPFAEEQFYPIPEDVVFIGYVPDSHLSALYRAAECFVYPSLYEGFGLPPLEAMACDCPVISSNRASLPEVCGDAPYYVNPDSINSITRGIIEVISNDRLRNDMIRKGRLNVNRFDWAMSAAKVMRVFDEVLATAGS